MKNDVKTFTAKANGHAVLGRKILFGEEKINGIKFKY